MSYTVLIHVSGEEAIMAEMENLPGLQDQMIVIENPRRRDGKELHYIQHDVNKVLWPLAGISFIEIIPSGVEEDVISFVRE